MAEVGGLYTAAGVAVTAWFWPDGDRVCPLSVPPSHVTLSTGDIVVHLPGGTEADFRALLGTGTPLTLAEVRLAYPGALREELVTPTLAPPTPTKPRITYQPGYRRVVRGPETGGAITVREQRDADNVHRAHTAYADEEVLHVHIHGEPDPHGPAPHA